eukprot:TRINITY_DN53930_c0_g1_i1.p1 TRINITY_DN53930_c0_g1~~TRINITY_DN53930_c0_g1_i1.p1  ORF type:complete len:245 (+),score=37.40 TRINITY_DN53930_c0_g1_i1:22-735(+)
MGNNLPQSHHYLTAPEGQPKRPVPVYLNVYDLGGSKKMDTIGIGIYHTGIEVYGVEFAFGGGQQYDPDVTGVFALHPHTACPGFRMSIALGQTTVTQQQLAWFLKGLEREWPASSYDLLKRNCNHFSEALAQKLGVTVPAWVNRAARLGDMLIPRSVLEAALRMLAPPAPVEDNPCTTCDCKGDDEEAEAVSSKIPDDLSTLSVRQLKTLLYIHGMDWEDCVERADLESRLRSVPST